MMFNYPFLHFPYYNKYSRYGYHYPNYGYPIRNEISTSTKNNSFKSDTSNSSKKITTSEIISSDCNIEEDVPVFEIFGIKLYFDDILLVCLIFFLYNEGVKDQSLFISLILLLLS